jgi:raffinose/stachyose/melibiose transport system substrate-binding protein
VKKVLSLFIVCCLSLSLAIAGCSKNGSVSNEEDSKKVTLTLLSWESEEAMKPVLEGFSKKYPDISIKMQWAPPVKDYISKLQTMLLSNSATDMFVMAAENRNQLIDGGNVLDLTNEPFMQGVSDINKQTYSKDGKVYTFSPSAWAGGIFYNKKLFQQAGINKEPQTWQEFIDVSKKLKQAGIIPLYDSVQDVPMILNGLYAAENISANPDIDSEIFAEKTKFEDTWTKTLELWYDGLVKNKIIDPNMVGVSNDQMMNEFITGNIAMITGGPWNVPTIQQGNPDLDFKMMPIPGSQPNTAYFGGAPGIGYSINKNTKHKEEALKFLDYLASPEGLEAYSKGTGQIITAKGYESKVDPSLESAYKDGLLQDKIYLPMISWERHQEALRSQFVISIQDLLIGKISPKEAASSLDKKYKEMEGKE